ncbi:PTS IIA-like nitrogen regulatory protein PtsN [Pikeienuella piscinae]|uniref:PTS IIA-like nitrogen regulatory protein PtsN n=1 Tax=Pikeienuella piscinae TaxID=2748098 RepID=A0A7L5BVW1_9RHOB|nr:PTS IIA-like nitrogen regulatory protein PtsN [Pikeienuella piscinae]QIE54356.1 PTS IIA-like nitrogen regulatory protein PtsN [Pikeienuella piscinae]
MDLKNIVSPEALHGGLNTTSKKHLMQELAQRAADAYGLDQRAAFEALLERERLGPTGMGRGVAIPHARLAGLDRIVGVFTRLQRPIDYDAADGEPVDLVFALFAPEEAGADHLRALARISRCLRDSTVCAKLRAADDASAIYAVLTNPVDSKAA